MAEGNSFKKFLRGQFLIDEGAFKNWRIILIVLIASIMMITCSHQTDEKILKMAKLTKEIRSLKAEYIDSATKITRLLMESTVKDEVLKDSLFPSEEPPVKIVVKNKPEN